MLIRLGNRGSEVLRLQMELKRAGYSPGPIDGDFGPKTLAAVREYQRKHGLEIDGIAGPNTLKSLHTDVFEHHNHHAQRHAVHRPHHTHNNHHNSIGNFVHRMLNETRRHLGFHEGYNNRNPFSHYFGRPAEAWCADFVSYCASKAGAHLNTASAQGVADILRHKGFWKGRHNPQAGDAVTFCWRGNGGWADHVGIVEKVYMSGGHKYIQTIEGNSSNSVCRHTYRADSAVINGYGRIA